MKNNYFYISHEKETVDSGKLIKQIADSNWLTKDTILINCSPDYSSRVTQLVNHKLSFLNKNELYEVVDLPMPYPIMNQIWDNLEKNFIQFEKYLAEWVRKYITSNDKYLFIDSGTLRGKNFSRVKQAIRYKLEPDSYRFASLYLQSDSIFTPDFYVETFNKATQGGLLFEWENTNNPNWDY